MVTPPIWIGWCPWEEDPAILVVAASYARFPFPRDPVRGFNPGVVFPHHTGVASQSV
jgi:hypothetical protein